MSTSTETVPALITELTSVVVVDRAVLTQIPAAKMAEALAGINHVSQHSDKKTIVVDNINALKGHSRVLKAISEGSDDLYAVLEINSIDISSERIRQLQEFYKLRKSIIEDIKKQLMHSYQLAEVPEDWTVTEKITIGTTRVLRTGGNGYYIGLKALRTIWDHVVPYWADNISHVRDIAIQASGYHRDAHCAKNGVVLGCQTIQRYELEQVALHLGWPFPKECGLIKLKT